MFYNNVVIYGILDKLIMTLTLFHMIITGLVLLGVLVLFVREKVPAHLVAMTAMAVLLAFGVISSKQALSVFSNSACITIACMFVLSSALQRTGVIDLMGQKVIKAAEKNRKMAMIYLLSGVAVISTFMNNTPLVVILSPVVIAVAKQLQDYPSKYLIPLSYAAILGGTCSLIGTSTNILVDGVAQAHGQPPFAMFEITGLGIATAFAGMLFLFTFGQRLLPERMLLESELIDESTRKRYSSEAIIISSSPLIGKTLNEVQFTETEDYEIVDLIRNEESNRGKTSLIERLANVAFEKNIESKPLGKSSTLRDIPLQAGDRLVFKTHINELMELRKFVGISFQTGDNAISAPISTKETIVVEGLIAHNSDLIGKKITQLRLRRRYGCYVIAIHRDKKNIIGHLETLELNSGDVLLLEGAREELDKLFANEELISLSNPQQQNFNRKKAPFAVMALLAVVGLASFNVMPIEGLSIIGAMAVILTKCVSLDEAYESIEWSILMMIFGMLAVSIAMEQTGLIKIIVEEVAHLVEGLGPMAILMIVYFITSAITEVMSNNATAVLLTPVVIGLAESRGIDPRPFIVAVMFGASASFATPIGYQTNTYVYNAGNYTFKDFLRIGTPMNIITFIVASIVIPLIWKF
jgi:di/tricarboxylate transporter